MILFAVLISIFAIVCVRVWFVHVARMREMSEAHRRAREAALYGDANWFRHWDAYMKGPSDTRMMWQLHKWTHKQFYPASNT